MNNDDSKCHYFPATSTVHLEKSSGVNVTTRWHYNSKKYGMTPFVWAKGGGLHWKWRRLMTGQEVVAIQEVRKSSREDTTSPPWLSTIILTYSILSLTSFLRAKLFHSIFQAHTCIIIIITGSQPNWCYSVISIILVCTCKCTRVCVCVCVHVCVHL